MLVEVARGDADDVGAFLLQHLPVIAVGARGLEALLGGGAAPLVGVGDGDDLDVVEGAPDDVESVAVVAASGVADDGEGEVARHGVAFRDRCAKGCYAAGHPVDIGLFRRGGGSYDGQR